MQFRRFLGSQLLERLLEVFSVRVLCILVHSYAIPFSLKLVAFEGTYFSPKCKAIGLPFSLKLAAFKHP